jgi:plasmid stability protein
MVNLQVRNVPEDVHAVLKRRARQAGQSLSEYVLAVLTGSARQLTREEWFERLEERSPVDPGVPAVEMLHRARRERMERLGDEFSADDEP